MGEENSKRKSSYTKDTIISEELCEEDIALVDILFMHVLQDGYNIPPQYHDVKDSFSQIIRSCLKLHSIHPGKISCILSVKPAILVIYDFSVPYAYQLCRVKNSLNYWRVELLDLLMTCIYVDHRFDFAEMVKSPLHGFDQS